MFDKHYSNVVPFPDRGVPPSGLLSDESVSEIIAQYVDDAPKGFSLFGDDGLDDFVRFSACRDIVTQWMPIIAPYVETVAFKNMICLIKEHHGHLEKVLPAYGLFASANCKTTDGDIWASLEATQKAIDECRISNQEEKGFWRRFDRYNTWLCRLSYILEYFVRKDLVTTAAFKRLSPYGQSLLLGSMRLFVRLPKNNIAQSAAAFKRLRSFRDDHPTNIDARYRGSNSGELKTVPFGMYATNYAVRNSALKHTIRNEDLHIAYVASINGEAHCYNVEGSHLMEHEFYSDQLEAEQAKRDEGAAVAGQAWLYESGSAYHLAIHTTSAIIALTLSFPLVETAEDLPVVLNSVMEIVTDTAEVSGIDIQNLADPTVVTRVKQHGYGDSGLEVGFQLPERRNFGQG